MSKWKCEICGNEFENFHAQGFDNKIYCPLCYFKKENQKLETEKEQLNSLVNSCQEEIKDMILKQCLELTTNNDFRPPISAYNGVDIDDVVRTCKQLQDKKTYLDLVKENQELKKQLEEKNKPQIFIDTQDIEERYAEGLYQDYLEEENKKYKNIEELKKYVNKDFQNIFDTLDKLIKNQKKIIEKLNKNNLGE